MQRQRLAPAKVNLFLHVGRLRSDGYHPVCSLATFADVGDVVRLTSAETMGFSIEGPFAETLAGEADNLVTRARDLLLAGRDVAPFHLTLDKRLPIAAGLGGGSSDAAAALRLIGEAIGLQDQAAAQAVARQLGADALMCLDATPVLAEGRGDDLSPPPAFPDLPAVLVNPLRASPTGPVYRAYDDAGSPGGADRPDWPAEVSSVSAVAAFLADCRNDLEAPAIGLQSAIAEVLAALAARPETLLARMSGSGATCFALCADLAERDALALALADAHGDWWVQPCRLAGYSP
ncbi:MAG TPA: 4-(cytidine 5'-diphospho)-2-C-methyl-D-erythritol kinase [Caulobacteraceae bacterium]|nr:4-(cytidine 5'-diphospho)-2-C-methyl-D-erythritol kinase [Caulobacteraceae bacterium]